MPKQPDPQLKIVEYDGPQSTTNQAVSTPTPSLTPIIESRWLRVQEFLRARELAPTTLKAYEGELRRFCDWTPKAWHQVTRRDLERYKQFLQEGKSKRGKPRSPETIRRTLTTLQSFFRWLAICDYVVKDPTLLLELPKALPAVSKEFKTEEVHELRIEARGNAKLQARDLAMLSALEHGLRASEVVGLNVEDYDGERLHIKAAKDDSIGTVPLTQKARAAIDSYLSWRLRSGFEVTPASPLFISLSPRNKGERLGYHGLYKEFKKLAELCGIENAHPHRHRHTFATELVYSGMDSAKARRLTRHRTEGSFARYSQKALDAEAEREFLQRFGEE